MENKDKQRALNLLGIFVFLLLAFPRMNIRIGPIPFYVIDVFILGTYYYSTKLPFKKTRYSKLISIILFFALVSELFVIFETNTVFQPIYMIARTILAFSVFFSVSRIIESQEDLAYILKPALFAALITATVLILSSIPPTRNLAKNYLFSIKFLEPASDTVLNTYEKYSGALRGQSYVGVSILSGAFLNCIWPLILYLRRPGLLEGKTKILLQVVSFLIPIAVIMTYSRGAIMGLAFVIFGLLLFNVARFRNNLLILIGLSIMGFLYIGLDSNYFYFRRLEQSTTRVIDKPIEDRNETERLYAYIEPFTHIIDNPENIFFGHGFSRVKLDRRGSRYGLEGKNNADHAVFGKAYFAYGMTSAFIYVFILFSAIYLSWHNTSKKYNPFGYQFSRVLFASLLGFIPWFVFGHAAVSTPRGAMLFFLLIALIAIQSRLKPKKYIELQNEES